MIPLKTHLQLSLNFSTAIIMTSATRPVEIVFDSSERTYGTNDQPTFLFTPVEHVVGIEVQRVMARQFYPKWSDVFDVNAPSAQPSTLTGIGKQNQIRIVFDPNTLNEGFTLGIPNDLSTDPDHVVEWLQHQLGSVASFPTLDGRSLNFEYNYLTQSFVFWHLTLDFKINTFQLPNGANLYFGQQSNELAYPGQYKRNNGEMVFGFILKLSPLNVVDGNLDYLNPHPILITRNMTLHSNLGEKFEDSIREISNDSSYLATIPDVNDTQKRINYEPNTQTIYHTSADNISLINLQLKRLNIPVQTLTTPWKVKIIFHCLTGMRNQGVYNGQRLQPVQSNNEL